MVVGREHETAARPKRVAFRYQLDRRAGIGRQLMAYAEDQARRSGLRAIVCETQNTNAAAIMVYRKLGFTIEGIDISLYANTDYPDGDIAVSLKRRLRQ